MNGYPYGGSPYPGAPYGGGPYGMPAARPGQTVREPNREGKRALFLTVNLLGAGMLGYLILCEAVSLLIYRIPTVKTLFTDDLGWQYAINILFSYLCVGLPMLIVFLILRRTRCQRPLAIPLGRAYGAFDALLLLFAGLGVCLLGNVATGYIGAYAESFGFGFFSFREMSGGEPAPRGALQTALFVLQTALAPALIEELGFRGVALQSLRKFGDRYAIVFSALLFALMHRNMTQFFFAFVAGLALGYAAVVSGSLWTGILIHCMNNMFSVAVVMLTDRVSETTLNLAYTVLMYGLIALGLLALAFYLIRRRGALRLRSGVYGGTDKKVLRTLISPAMLAAIVWMCFYLLVDIVPIGEALGFSL